MAQRLPPARTAPDGSPYPDRSTASFEREVRTMFTFIARHYERFNHLATFGQDFLWRARSLWELDRFRRVPIVRALDVGCGTGEFARAVATHYPSARVVATDLTLEMVRRARGAAPGGAGGERLQFGRASALRLPFADRSFDLVTNAFVLRNLSSLPAGLAEMRRVLRPGGVLLSLEVGEPSAAPIRAVFHAHFDHVVPLLGRAFGSEGPYRYLPESLRGLPDRPRLLAMHGEAGFSRHTARTQSLGVVTVYLAEAGAPSEESR